MKIAVENRHLSGNLRMYHERLKGKTKVCNLIVLEMDSAEISLLEKRHFHMKCFVSSFIGQDMLAQSSCNFNCAQLTMGKLLCMFSKLLLLWAFPRKGVSVVDKWMWKKGGKFSHRNGVYLVSLKETQFGKANSGDGVGNCYGRLVHLPLFIYKQTDPVFFSNQIW